MSAKFNEYTVAESDLYLKEKIRRKIKGDTDFTKYILHYNDEDWYDDLSLFSPSGELICDITGSLDGEKRRAISLKYPDGTVFCDAQEDSRSRRLITGKRRQTKFIIHLEGSTVGEVQSFYSRRKKYYLKPTQWNVSVYHGHLQLKDETGSVIASEGSKISKKDREIFIFDKQFIGLSTLLLVCFMSQKTDYNFSREYSAYTDSAGRVYRSIFPQSEAEAAERGIPFID